MPVKTTRGKHAEDYDACIVRGEGCRGLTTMWWGGGCITVCSNCSALPTTTDALMRSICERDGWGPVPQENTDLPDEPEVPGNGVSSST